MGNLQFDDIKLAYERIKGHVVNTPVLTNEFINDKYDCEIFFKIEAMQKCGAFKFRGVINKLLRLKEEGRLPKKVVAASSGNHAQAVAYACRIFGIEALIYMDLNVSGLKIAATKSHGAQVVLCENRAIAYEAPKQKEKEGYYFIHPSNDDDIICGQGTACLEAINEAGEMDAIFAPVGGGGLIAGTYLAAQNQKKKKAQIFACEPIIANDTAISLRQGEIFSFDKSPDTIADGVKTWSPSPLCFEYIKKIDGVFEISERDIVLYSQMINHCLKVTCEPTSALSMAGADQYLRSAKKGERILVIISGGNIAAATYAKIWQKNYL